MTPRDVLAEIEQRIAFDVLGDNKRMVAALRAVLDLHVGDGEGYGGKVMCAYCSWLDEDMLVEFPCRTIRAIAEALGGGA